ncbi:MAG: hypothetical protein PHV74_03065 [Dehalococcoidia bacterium]|nr:hypothetical protein [Dehalococcoidia bacterium]
MTETESMAAEWEKWLAQEKANIQVLEEKIEGLSSGYDSPDGFKYREFWAEANEISAMFETLTPLSPDDKEKLQEKYGRVCGEAKRRQQQEMQARRAQTMQIREKQEREWQSRRGESKQTRELVEKKVKEALSGVESNPEDIMALSKSQTMLSEALVLLKGKPKERGSDPAAESQKAAPVVSNMTREDEQACWEMWRQANDLVFGRRKALWDRSYSQLQPEAKAALDEANEGDAFKALDKVKEAQNHLRENPLSKSQREEIKSVLNSAWDVAIAKVDGIREVKRRKQEDWIGRTKTQVERWGKVIQENKEEIAELEGQMKRHQIEIKAARAPEYSDMLRKLIREKRQKVEAIKTANKDLEERIVSMKAKLSDQEKAKSAPVASKANLKENQEVQNPAPAES